jgi:hypothetical protein
MAVAFGNLPKMATATQMKNKLNRTALRCIVVCSSPSSLRSEDPRAEPQSYYSDAVRSSISQGEYWIWLHRIKNKSSNNLTTKKCEQ